jgi:hypothetical protein
MLFAYDSDGLRALGAAFSGAMGTVQSAGGVLSEAETSDFSKRISENLMKAFDLGERNTEALKRVALRGVSFRRAESEMTAAS